MDFTNRQKTTTSMPAILLLLMLNVTASIYDMKRFKQELEQSIAESRDFQQRIGQVEFNAFQFKLLDGNCPYEAFKFCSDVCKSSEPLKSHTLIEIRRKHHRDITEKARLVDVISCLHKAVSQNDTNEVFTVDTQLAVYNIRNDMLKSFLMMSDEYNEKKDMWSKCHEDHANYCAQVINETLKDKFSKLVFNVTALYFFEKSPHEKHQNPFDDEHQKTVVFETIYDSIVESLKTDKFAEICTSAFAHAYDEKRNNDDYSGDMEVDQSNDAPINQQNTGEHDYTITEQCLSDIFEYVKLRTIPLILKKFHEFISRQKHVNFMRSYGDRVMSIFEICKSFTNDWQNEIEIARQTSCSSTDKYFHEVGICDMIWYICTNKNSEPASKPKMRAANSTLRILCNVKITPKNMHLLSLILLNADSFFHQKMDKLLYVNLRKAIIFTQIFDALKNVSTSYKNEISHTSIGPFNALKFLTKKRNSKHISCYDINFSDPAFRYKPKNDKETSNNTKNSHETGLLKPKTIAINGNISVATSWNGTSKAAPGSGWIEDSNYVIVLARENAGYTVQIGSTGDINGLQMMELIHKLEYNSFAFTNIHLLVKNDKENFSWLNFDIPKSQLLLELSWYLRFMQLFPGFIQFPALNPVKCVNCYHEGISIYNMNKQLCTVNFTTLNAFQTVNDIFSQYQWSNIGDLIPFRLTVSSKDILYRHGRHRKWTQKTNNFVANTGIAIDRLEELLDRCVLDEKFLNTSKSHEIRLAMLKKHQLKIYYIPQEDSSPLVFVVRDEPENKLNILSIYFNFYMYSKCMEAENIKNFACTFDQKFGILWTEISALAIVFKVFCKLKFDLLTDIKTQYRANQFDFLMAFLQFQNEKDVDIRVRSHIWNSQCVFVKSVEYLVSIISNFVDEHLRKVINTHATRVIATSLDGLNSENMICVEKLRKHLLKRQ